MEKLRDTSCSAGDAQLTHPSIQLVINFFLSIYSLPDTARCWVNSGEQRRLASWSAQETPMPSFRAYSHLRTLGTTALCPDFQPHLVPPGPRPLGFFRTGRPGHSQHRLCGPWKLKSRMYSPLLPRLPSFKVLLKSFFFLCLLSRLLRHYGPGVARNLRGPHLAQPAWPHPAGCSRGPRALAKSQLSSRSLGLGPSLTVHTAGLPEFP
ncbi:uncharacterized protein LOC109489099 [Ailuropoda melanoleuca]|uniref:uncharacterized protein LOC109489099 n=1 Tax=Ailuropoda melanoleuca TaxID=9646 RepID=UPI000947F961|nr:uncharacterized protein LOC109489099 [Ailuropoda melanoleuca]